MDKINEFFSNFNHVKIINSIIIAIASLILYRVISHFLTRSEKKESFQLFMGKRSQTYFKLIKSLLRYIFLLITVLIIFQINGINVSSVLAGVGILGAILGLAIQDWLKDIIRGSSILSDNYFSVGDIIKYNDIEGKVLVIGLKTTKIQDIRTGNVKSIANRKIEEVDLVSNLVYLNIPMPYELQVAKAEKLANSIVEQIKENKDVSGCRYLGINELAGSCINHCIEITCNQNKKLQVRRDALKTIIETMEKERVAVPYTQIDVHNKL